MPDNADTYRFINQHPISEIVVAYAECACVMANRAQKQVDRIMDGGAGIPAEFRGYSLATWDGLPDHLKAGKDAARFACEVFANGNLYMQDSGEEKIGLVLSGEVGTGKSGLASATAMERAQRGSSVLWIDFAKYIRKVRATYGNDSDVSYDEIVNAATGVGLLIFDDFGDAASNRPVTDNLRSIVYDVVSERYSEKRPTLFTTNLTESQMLDHFGDRLTSRILRMCAWVDMGHVNIRNQHDPLFNHR